MYHPQLAGEDPQEGEHYLGGAEAFKGLSAVTVPLQSGGIVGAAEEIVAAAPSLNQSFLEAADESLFTQAAIVPKAKKKKRLLLIQQVLYKLKGVGLKELYGLTQEALPYVQTNIAPQDLKGLVNFVPQVLGADIRQLTIPQPEHFLDGTYLPDGRILTRIDFQASGEALKNLFMGRKKSFSHRLKDFLAYFLKEKGQVKVAGYRPLLAYLKKLNQCILTQLPSSGHPFTSLKLRNSTYCIIVH